MASGAGALDMALDDIISQNKSNRRQSNRSGPRSGGGATRSSRGFRAGNNNFSPRGSSAFSSQPQPRVSRNMLTITNLHYNVTEADLYELFGQVGPLKRAFLHLSPSGGSAGVADVVFVHPNDAERALAQYNNVELDGRPMRISFASQTVPSTAPSQSFGGPVRRPLRSSGGPRQSSGGRGPRGGSRRRQQNNRPKPTEADLDADMDSYMAAPGIEWMRKRKAERNM
ncbi:hypothetical protein VTP01DRAFT_2890 [Rhizomucor pusillus]|uniref:uncharacterized protein n=1 Tax=Rhizomucor pusillus TaxID=4840 RepID=UPI0037438411